MPLGSSSDLSVLLRASCDEYGRICNSERDRPVITPKNRRLSAWWPAIAPARELFGAVKKTPGDSVNVGENLPPSLIRATNCVAAVKDCPRPVDRQIS